MGVTDRRDGERRLVAARFSGQAARHEVDDLVSVTCAAALDSRLLTAVGRRLGMRASEVRAIEQRALAQLARVRELEGLSEAVWSRDRRRLRDPRHGLRSLDGPGRELFQCSSRRARQHDQRAAGVS